MAALHHIYLRVLGLGFRACTLRIKGLGFKV